MLPGIFRWSGAWLKEILSFTDSVPALLNISFGIYNLDNKYLSWVGVGVFCFACLFLMK